MLVLAFRAGNRFGHLEDGLLVKDGARVPDRDISPEASSLIRGRIFEANLSIRRPRAPWSLRDPPVGTGNSKLLNARIEGCTFHP